LSVANATATHTKVWSRFDKPPGNWQNE